MATEAPGSPPDNGLLSASPQFAGLESPDDPWAYETGKDVRKSSLITLPAGGMEELRRQHLMQQLVADSDSDSDSSDADAVPAAVPEPIAANFATHLQPRKNHHKHRVGRLHKVELLAMKAIDGAIWLAFDAGFLPRLLRFLGLIVIVHLLGYFGVRISVTITVATLVFYHGWHNECSRLDQRRQEMQREFDENVDYKSLKNIPPWFVYPDVERAEWLNQFLQKLWPKMKQAIGQSINDSVQPLLDYYKPGFLSHLAFDKLDMGNKALRITGVSSYDTDAEGVMLDLDVAWNGNPHIVVGVGKGAIYLPIELLDLTLTAKMRLCFVHPTTMWPCFGAMQMAFVGKPLINFRLKAAKMDIMSMPMVNSWLENFLKTTLAGVMVWPRVIHIPILEGEEFEQDTSMGESGYGYLQITLVHAKGMKKSSNPYCVYDLTNKVAPLSGEEPKPKTSGVAKWVAGGERHQWSQEVHNLKVTDPFTQELVLTLFNKKNMRIDTKKGTAHFKISELKENVRQEVTAKALPHLSAEVTVELLYMPFKVESDEGEEESKIGIEVSPSLSTSSQPQLHPGPLDLNSPASAATAPTRSQSMRRRRVGSGGSVGQVGNRPLGALNIHLHRASNLMKMDRFGKSDPYCVFTCGTRKWKSSCISRSLSPEWQEEATLVVFKVEHEVLLMEMFDKDDVGSDDFMGRVRVNVEDIVAAGVIPNRTYTLLDAKKGDVTFSVRWRPL